MNSAKMKLMIGGLLIAAGIGSLGVLAASQSGAYAIDVKDYVATPQKWKDHGLRMAGIAVKDSWHKTENHHVFKIAEATQLDETVPVDFQGTMPDTFREESMVIVEGRIGEDGTFKASAVYPQCASKYEGVPKGYVKQGGKTIPVFEDGKVGS